MCMQVYIIGNNFETVRNVAVMEEIKVSQEGPIYAHINFCTSACVQGRTAARNMKGACVLALISQTTYIQ